MMVCVCVCVLTFNHLQRILPHLQTGGEEVRFWLHNISAVTADILCSRPLHGSYLSVQLASCNFQECYVASKFTNPSSQAQRRSLDVY